MILIVRHKATVKFLKIYNLRSRMLFHSSLL